LMDSGIFERVIQPGWNPLPRSAIYAADNWSTLQPSISGRGKFVLVWNGEPLWVHSEYLMRVNTAGGISVACQTCRTPSGGIGNIVRVRKMIVAFFMLTHSHQTGLCNVDGFLLGFVLGI
jgi:hypothetical protein